MRKYRVVLAASEAGLYAAAKDWTILGNTVREFSQLESHTDRKLKDVGYVLVDQNGFVCLAYKDT
jgi:hypothetical protein